MTATLVTSTGKTVFSERDAYGYRGAWVDPGLSLSDPGWVVLPRATATITLAGGQQWFDYLRFYSDVNLGGSLATQGENTSTLTLTGIGMTVAQWQEALSHVAVNTIGQVTAPKELTVRFSFDDGMGSLVWDTKTVVIEPVNSMPMLAPGLGRLDSGAKDVPLNLQVLADGSIAVSGSGNTGNGANHYYFTEWRLRADGTVDTGFSNKGLQVAPFPDLGANNALVEVLTLPDGKLLAIGSRFETTGGYRQSWVAARYTADGRPDTSFGDNGVFTFTAEAQGASSALAATVLSNGKIVLVGSNADVGSLSGALLRLTADGKLDTSFGQGGVVRDVEAVPLSVTALKDGQLLVGERVYLSYANGTGVNSVQFSRYNADGSLDKTFGQAGHAVVRLAGMQSEEATTLVQQPDGRLLVLVQTRDGVSQETGTTLLRLNANGSLDTSFGGTGRVDTPLIWTDWGTNQLLRLDDGSLLVAGEYRGQYAVARYTAAGSLDAHFGTGGLALAGPGAGYSTQVGAIALDANGKIVLAAQAGDDMVVVRFNADGSVDSGFGPVMPVALGGSTALAAGNSWVLGDFDVNGNLPASTFAGGTLTLTREGGANAHDVFAASGQLGALTEGRALVWAGQSIGEVVVNHAGMLKLVFNSGATSAAVNQALYWLTYSNSADAAGVMVRLVWTYTDSSPEGKLPVNTVSATQRVQLTGSSTPGATLAGTVGADSFASTPGNDTAEGFAGLDSMRFAGRVADYRVSVATEGGVLVAHVSDVQQARDGNDTLRDVERLKFTDGALALDMAPTQAGGQAALMLAAVLGTGALADKGLASTFLRFFDGGGTLRQGAQLLLDTGLISALAGGSDAESVVAYIYKNVHGTAIDGTQGFLQVAAYTRSTPADWLAGMAASADSQQHVGLVGYAATGLQYTV